MKQCSLCLHPQAETINRDLATPRLSLTTIAQRHGVSRDALHRHRRDHLTQDALALPAPISPIPAPISPIPATLSPATGRTREGRQPSQPAVQALDVELLKRSRVLLWKDKEERILAAFTDDKIQKMGGPQLAVAGGIATDKVRFWSGADKTESGVTVHVPASIRHSIALALKLTPADRPDGSPEEPGGKSR